MAHTVANFLARVLVPMSAPHPTSPFGRVITKVALGGHQHAQRQPTRDGSIAPETVIRPTSVEWLMLNPKARLETGRKPTDAKDPTRDRKRNYVFF